VRRSTFVVFALVLTFTLTLGLVLQPDDGTAVSRPEGVGLKVDGANHAKPLPRIISISDLVSVLTISIAALVAVVAAASVWLPRRRDEVPLAQRRVLARALARRGPPALV
jgi:hypothetical protein